MTPTRVTRIMVPILAACFAAGAALMWWRGDEPAWICAVICAVSGFVIYYHASGVGVMYLWWRAFLALVPVAFVGVVLAFGVKELAGWWGVDDPKLQTGVVAALVVALGWLVGIITQEFRRLDQRHERRADLIAALISEAEYAAAFVAKADWSHAVDRMVHEIHSSSAKKPYAPLLVSAVPTRILGRVMDEIEILDQNQIAQVNAYSHLIFRIRDLEEILNTADIQRHSRVQVERAMRSWVAMNQAIPDAAYGMIESLKSQPNQGWFERPN